MRPPEVQLESNGTAPPVRVLIVDNSNVFLGAATAVVNHAANFELVGVASSGEDGLAGAASLRPNLVMMDVNMPGIGGVEAARRLRAAHPQTVVVLMTAARPPTNPLDRVDPRIASIDKRSFSQSTLCELWNRHGRA